MYQELFNKQVTYFSKGLTYEYEFRLKMLKKLKSMIVLHQDEILNALYLDLGKSSAEAYMCEVGLVINSLNYFIKHLKKLMKPKKVKTLLANFPSTSLVIKDPRGVCLIMSPWNYPVLLTLDPLIGAIAGGNTAIVKLSSHSINTSRLLEKLINENFEEEYITALLIKGSQTDELLKLHFDYIFFTGSKKIGMHVMEMASKNLIPLTLELGGKSPCIITKNANLDVASARVAFGKIINAGQTCVAPDYICVERSVKDEFIKLLKKQITSFLGSNILENNDYPKIISEFHLERLLGLIDKEKLVFGGHNKNQKLEPTILDNVSFQDKVMGEEIFGPIIPIIPYDDIYDVLNYIKQNPLPLALYVFSENKKEIKEVTTYTRFGGGCINDTLMHLVSESLPFGGVGFSGMGKYHGKYTFDSFTCEKGILKKSTKIDISLRYPPYNEKKTKTIKKFFK